MNQENFGATIEELVTESNFFLLKNGEQ